MMTHATTIPSTAPKAMSTPAIIAEINLRGPMLDAAAKRMNPNDWVKAGNKLFDFKLSSGKRLGNATREDLGEQATIEGNLMAHNQRQAELYEELACRLPVKDPKEAGLIVHFSAR